MKNKFYTFNVLFLYDFITFEIYTNFLMKKKRKKANLFNLYRKKRV